jgi:hypothetical protein
LTVNAFNFVRALDFDGMPGGSAEAVSVVKWRDVTIKTMANNELMHFLNMFVPPIMYDG